MKTKHLQKIFISCIYAMLISMIFFLIPLDAKAQTPVPKPIVATCDPDVPIPPPRSQCCYDENYTGLATGCRGGYIIDQDGDILFSVNQNVDNHYMVSSAQSRLFMSIKEFDDGKIELRAYALGRVLLTGTEHFILYSRNNLKALNSEGGEIATQPGIPLQMGDYSGMFPGPLLNGNLQTISTRNPVKAMTENLTAAYLFQIGQLNHITGNYKNYNEIWANITFPYNIYKFLDNDEALLLYTMHFEKTDPGKPLEIDDFGFYASGNNKTWKTTTGGSIIGDQQLRMTPETISGGTIGWMSMPDQFEYRSSSSVITNEPLTVNSQKAILSGNFKQGNYAPSDLMPVATYYLRSGDYTTPPNYPLSLFQIQNFGTRNWDNISEYGFIYTTSTVANLDIKFNTDDDFVTTFTIACEVGGSAVQETFDMDDLITGDPISFNGDLFYIVKKTATVGGEHSIEIDVTANEHYSYWAFALNSYGTDASAVEFINVGAKKAFDAVDCMDAAPELVIPDLCDATPLLEIDNNAYYQSLITGAWASREIVYELYFDDGNGESLVGFIDDTTPAWDISATQGGIYRVNVIITEDYDLHPSVPFCEIDTTIVVAPCGGAFAILQTVASATICNNGPTLITIDVTNTSTTSDYDFVMEVSPEAGLTELSGSTTDGTYAAGTWTSSLVVAGATVTLEIEYSGANLGTLPIDLKHRVAITDVNNSPIPVPLEDSISITVLPEPTVADADDVFACADALVAPINLTGVYTSFSYTVGTAIGLADGDYVTQIPSFTAVNATNAVITANVVVTPHYTYNGISCDGAVMDFDITILPIPTTVVPINAAYCDGDIVAIDFTALAGNASNAPEVEYRWERIAGFDFGLNATSGTDVMNFTAQNTGIIPLVALYQITPYYVNNGIECSGTPQNFFLTVNPVPVIAPVSDQIYCAKEIVSGYTFTSNIPDATYYWELTSATSMPGVPDEGYDVFPSFTATNTGDAALVYEYKVTAMYAFANKTCENLTTFTITVNPEPTVWPENDVILCAGNAPDITFYGTGIGATTHWFWEASSNAGFIGLGLTGANILNADDFSTGVAENNTAAPITVQIKVTPAYENPIGFYCYGDPMYFNITVDPIPTVVQILDMETCAGKSINEIVFTGDVQGTTYSWINDETSIGLGSYGMGNIPSFIAVNNTDEPIEATIQVYPKFGSGDLPSLCEPADPMEFIITVNPVPVMETVGDVIVCDAEPVAITFGSNMTNNVVFNWAVDNPANAIAIGMDLNDLTTDNITFTAENTTDHSIIVVVTVTPTYWLSGANLPTCVGESVTFSITVNPTSGLTMTAVTDKLYCHGTDVPAFEFTSNIEGALYFWEYVGGDPIPNLPIQGYGNIPAFHAENNTGAVLIGNYQVTATYEGCKEPTPAPNPTIFDIVVAPMPVLYPVSSVTVCDNTPVLIEFDSNIEAEERVDYDWYVDNVDNATAIGMTNLTSPSTAMEFTAINTTANPITVIVTVTPTYWMPSADFPTCVGEPVTFSITVSPLPNMMDVADQIVCVGEMTAEVDFGSLNAPVGTIFRWTNNNISIGLPAEGTGNIPPFVVWADVTATITVTAEYTNGSAFCNGDEIDFTITGVYRPIMTPMTNITVCANDEVEIPPFTSTAINPVYEWRYVSGADLGLELVGQGNMLAFTAINEGTTPLTALYAAKVTEVGYCESEEIFFTITVNPIPTVDAVGEQIYCNKTQVPAHVFTGNVPGATYYWMQTNYMIENVPELPQEGYNILPAFTAVNLTPYPIVLEYEVVPFFEYNGVACEGEPKVFTIIINPVQEIAPMPNLSFCAGDMTEPIEFTGTAGEYRWKQILGDVITTDFDLFAGDVNVIPSFETTNTGNTALTAVIQVTPWTENGYCSGEAIEFTITVKPIPTVYPVANQGPYCAGAQTADIVFVGDTPGTVFHWTNDAPEIGLAAAGTGNIHAFTVQNLTNEQIIATIVVTPEFKGDPNDACEGDPIEFTIMVNPTPTVDPIADMTFCKEAQTAFIEFTGAVVDAEYRWIQISGDVITTDFDLFAGGTGNIPSFTTVNSGNNILTAVIQVVPWTEDGLCKGNLIEFTITIVPTPTVDQPSTLPDFCAGDVAGTINFTGNTEGTIYRWTNDAPEIGLAAEGTGNIPAFTTVNNTDEPIVATITVTPEIIQGNPENACIGEPVTFTITVNPKPVINPVSNIAVCAVEEIEIEFSSSNMTTNVEYNWYVNSIANATAIGMTVGSLGEGTGDIFFTTENATMSPISVTITVTPWSINDDLMPLCAGDPIIFTITVDPTPTVAEVADQEVCVGATTVPITFQGNVPGTLFSWTNSNPEIGLQSDGWGDIAPFVAQNPTNAPIIATITVTPSFGSGIQACPGDPLEISFTITVNPIPVVDQILDVTYCANFEVDTLEFTSTADEEYVTYTWTQIAGPYIGTDISGVDNFPGFTTVNNGLEPITALYEVIATVGICESDPVYFTITVNPTPHIDPIANKVYCANTAVPMYEFTGAVSGTLYTWTIVGGDDIGLLPGSGIGSMPPFTTIDNNTDHILTATYRVAATFSYNGVPCGYEEQEFTISVLPNATVTNLQNVVYCHNQYVDIPMFEGVATTWRWAQIEGPEVGVGQNNGEGKFPAFFAKNAGDTPITALYKVTSFYEVEGISCQGAEGYFTITVNPQPFLNTIPEEMVYCHGTPVSPYAFSGTYGATYYWNYVSGDIIPGVPNSGTGLFPSFIANNNEDDLLTATFEAWAEYKNQDGSICTSDKQQFSISILPIPVVDNATNRVFCAGENVATYLFEGNVSYDATVNVTYKWMHISGDIGSLVTSGYNTIPSFTAKNNDIVSISARYKVTPYVEYKGLECAGDDFYFTWTVDPLAVITLINTNTNTNNAYEVCNDAGNVEIPYSTTQTGMNMEYTLAFSADAHNAGFQDITVYQDLPKDYFTVTLPINVPVGIYEATITVRAKDSELGYCTTSYTFKIDVKQYFEITAEFESSEMIVCDDSELVLTIEVSPAHASLTYTWYHNGTQIPDVNSNTYRKFPVTKDDSGEYYVVVTGNDICGEAVSSTINVIVRQAIIGQKWDDVLYVDNSKDLYHSYRWYRVLDNGDKDYIAGATSQYWSENPLHGTYGVEVLDTYGNLIGESCTFEVTTSPKNTISIYPNPVAQGNMLTVVMDMEPEMISGSRIDVYDMVGKLIRTRVIDGRTTRVTMEVVPGVYAVRITGASGETLKSEKVIVR